MITEHFKGVILKEVFNIDNTGISSFYLGLSTTNPGTTGVQEPSSNGNYKRKLINTSGSLSDLVFRSETHTIENKNDIIFDASTSNWGTVSHWVLYDSSTGGNLLAYGALMGSNNPRPHTVEAGTVIKIPYASLEFSISGE